MAPLAYFITFLTYGSWLHGDDRGTMDPQHAVFGDPRLPRDDFRRRSMIAELKNEPPVLTAERRPAVESAIRGVCETNAWALHAINVRTNHVHIVVSSEETPEQVMRAFKSWSTRRLRAAGLVGPGETVWSRATGVLGISSASEMWNRRACM